MSFHYKGPHALRIRVLAVPYDWRFQPVKSISFGSGLLWQIHANSVFLRCTKSNRISNAVLERRPLRLMTFEGTEEITKNNNEYR